MTIKPIRRDKGFTLIELMIVIAIIGILAAIAIPNFISYRERTYNAAANADIKNMFTAAQAYFTERPTGTVGAGDLVTYGYVASPNVTSGISVGTHAGLTMTASHGSSTRVYTVGPTGVISY